jgi:hypothetical protein
VRISARSSSRVVDADQFEQQRIGGYPGFPLLVDALGCAALERQEIGAARRTLIQLNPLTRAAVIE